MALEETITELQKQVTLLHADVEHLSWATDAKHPERNELADNLRDRATKLVGFSMSAVEHAAVSKNAAGRPADITEVGQGLLAIEVQVNKVADGLWNRLEGIASYDTTGELIMLAQRRHEDWRSWTRGVGDAIEGCQDSLIKVMVCVTTCWQEILERAANTSISVKTTNVGPIGLAERWPARQEVS